MPTFRFDKLVRDDVLQRCLDDPKVLHTDYKILEGEEYKEALIDKLHEEAAEVPVQSEADDEVLAEIADLQDVLDALRESYGLTAEQVAQAQRLKVEKSGAFAAVRAYIMSVEVTDDSEWVQYFRARPEKYPEVKYE